MRPIPVLMYHHVNPHKGDMITVTPEVFDGQMRHISEAGYRTLDIDELVSYLHGGLVLEQKAVAVTFDDGWLDNYLFAWPILEKYGIKAAVFIVTDWVEEASGGDAAVPAAVPVHGESKGLVFRGLCRQVILNWDLISKMSGSGLVNFYSHTRSHAECDKIAPAALLEELTASRTVIEERLKRPCPYLCWPRGKYNDAAVSSARDAGYKALFTTNAGVVTTGSDPFAISRIVVKDSVPWFKKRMSIYTNSLLSGLYLMIKRK